MHNGNISLPLDDFNYELPEERIAKYPLANRGDSKLLHYCNGAIQERRFVDISSLLPAGSLLVFNNTKVIRARIIMQKESGGRIEIFCLEPLAPSDYERAFAVKGSCEWSCIVGNSKRWKSGEVYIEFEGRRLWAERIVGGERSAESREHIIRFRWDSDDTFGQILDSLGRIPIPPYLCRESEECDNTRYQTIYSKIEGSVAAPTAGLHFTQEHIAELHSYGIESEEVTLHVGAGTFLPVKSENAADHPMHTEHFDITLATLRNLLSHHGSITAVGTTSVRTLESLSALAYRIQEGGEPECDRVIGQWELYDIPTTFSGRDALHMLISYMESHGLDRLRSSTQIMITPRGYHFRIVSSIITNFHQPKSTLLLLVSAYVGDDWRRMYEFALAHDFRFLSYGDSSLLQLSAE